jgi:hypothetical protein
MSLLSENSCACSLRDCCDMFDVIYLAAAQRELELKGNFSLCSEAEDSSCYESNMCIKEALFGLFSLVFCALALSLEGVPNSSTEQSYLILLARSFPCNSMSPKHVETCRIFISIPRQIIRASNRKSDTLQRMLQ